MDNDSGWAAREVTLTAHEQDEHRGKVTLPCRWVELVQAWNGVGDAYFLVSGVPEADIPDDSWAFLSFKDAGGKAHRFPIGAVSRQAPTALRLMRSTKTVAKPTE